VIVDYHMHLRGKSTNGEGPIEHTLEAVGRFVDSAAARGIDEIAFTEHVYYFREFEELIEHPYQRKRVGWELATYCETVLEAKRLGLPVKLGLEVDWFPGREAELAEILAPYPWDFLLGSIHILAGEAIDKEPGLWDRLPVEDIWGRYFSELGNLAASGLVDVLAHPDLVKIFDRRPSEAAVAAHHEEAAETIGAAGLAIEVSSAGLRRPVAEVYPAPSFLRRCRERGVNVTTASDAHHPGDVGRDLDRALDLLRETGYETVTVFDRRRPRQEPLG
jgi:histidinol-phosphatase (PHP family)